MAHRLAGAASLACWPRSNWSCCANWTKGPARRQRAHQAATAVRRVLDQEHHRAGIFAAHRKSLHHAQERQRDRRQQAECRVSRQKPDQEGRDRHGGDREGKCRAPPEAVADVADHHAADGPHQIAEREHAEG